MKKIAILSILLLALVSCGAQEDTTTPTPNNQVDNNAETQAEEVIELTPEEEKMIDEILWN